MKIVVFLLLITIAVTAAYLAVSWVSQVLKRRKRRRGVWEVEEESDHGRAVVYLRSPTPGQEYGIVGSVAFDSPDFDNRMRVLRREAQFNADALNEKLR